MALFPSAREGGGGAATFPFPFPIAFALVFASPSMVACSGGSPPPAPGVGSGVAVAAEQVGPDVKLTGAGCSDGGAGVFSAPNPWMRDVSCDPVAPSSTGMMTALAKAGGWGTGATTFQIDASLVVLHADGSTPLVPFIAAKGYTRPDCDLFSTIPLVPGGSIEGVKGYTCRTGGNDCHLLVDYPPTHTLYEVYQATEEDGGGIRGGCGILWDTSKAYPANLRGDQCTSADAAGFPLSAMLADADEVATGEVTHALRFALPNASIAAGVYVHPATHAGGPSGAANLPPYGVRLRLRADYPVQNLSTGAAQVLAKALQRFGMFLSDGGNVPLMVQSDKYTTAKWASLHFSTHMLDGIAPTDFEVVDLPARVTLTDKCKRNP